MYSTSNLAPSVASSWVLWRNLTVPSLYLPRLAGVGFGSLSLSHTCPSPILLLKQTVRSAPAFSLSLSLVKRASLHWIEQNMHFDNPDIPKNIVILFECRNHFQCPSIWWSRVGEGGGLWKTWETDSIEEEEEPCAAAPYRTDRGMTGREQRREKGRGAREAFYPTCGAAGGWWQTHILNRTPTPYVTTDIHLIDLLE